MSHVTCHMSMSLDGFVAGPDQSQENPLGRGGMLLHEWHLRADEPGFEAGIPARDELLRPMGAYVMGRNMFGPVRGQWSGDWRGWWGDEPPYHAPVFVLTHHPRESIEMAGGTTNALVRPKAFEPLADESVGPVGRGDAVEVPGRPLDQLDPVAVGVDDPRRPEVV